MAHNNFAHILFEHGDILDVASHAKSDKIDYQLSTPTFLCRDTRCFFLMRMCMAFLREQDKHDVKCNQNTSTSVKRKPNSS